MNNSLNSNTPYIINNKTYNIIFINNAVGVEPYRKVWNSMATHPHVDYNFYNMFISSRSEVLNPFFILILLDNQVMAMLIGRVEEKCIDMKFGYKTIIKPKARLLNISYKGFLGDSTEIYMDIFIDNVIKYSHFNNIDIVSLDHIPVDSYLYQSAINKPGLLSRDYIRKKESHWSMTLPGTMEDFYKAKTKKSRQSFKNAINKVNKNFHVTYKSFTDENNIDLLLNDAEEVAKRTYQRGLGVEFDRSKENDNRIKFIAKCGWLRACVLYLNGIPCSFAIGSLYNKVLYLNFIGYNPEYKKYEIGTILLLKMVENLIVEKVHEIDFGFGDAFYKQHFGNKNEIESSVCIYSTSIKGVMINILRTTIVGSSGMATKILKRMNILSKIKKYWRKQVIQKSE